MRLLPVPWQARLRDPRLAPAITWAMCLAAAALWHLFLHSAYYLHYPVSIWLEGPFPAALGAGFGLWLYRPRAGLPAPSWLVLLAASAYATLGMLMAVLVLGPLLIGFGATLRGLWGFLTNGFGFAAFAVALDPKLWGTPLVHYVGWMMIKALLMWGAFGYFAALFFRHDGKTWLHWRWRDLLQRRRFRRHQKQLAREYQHLYLQALGKGEAPPPLPPGYVPGAVVADSDGARTLYWLIRIGWFLVGGTLFWWAFGDSVELIARRLAIPMPWWMGLGR